MGQGLLTLTTPVGRGSPDPAHAPDQRSPDASGDLRSAESAGSGDPRRTGGVTSTTNIRKGASAREWKNSRFPLVFRIGDHQLDTPLAPSWCKIPILQPERAPPPLPASVALHCRCARQTLARMCSFILRSPVVPSGDNRVPCRRGRQDGRRRRGSRRSTSGGNRMASSFAANRRGQGVDSAALRANHD